MPTPFRPHSFFPSSAQLGPGQTRYNWKVEPWPRLGKSRIGLTIVFALLSLTLQAQGLKEEIFDQFFAKPVAERLNQELREFKRRMVSEAGVKKETVYDQKGELDLVRFYHPEGWLRREESWAYGTPERPEMGFFHEYESHGQETRYWRVGAMENGHQERIRTMDERGRMLSYVEFDSTESGMDTTSFGCAFYDPQGRYSIEYAAFKKEDDLIRERYEQYNADGHPELSLVTEVRWRPERHDFASLLRLTESAWPEALSFTWKEGERVKRNVSRPSSKIEYSYSNGLLSQETEIVWRYGEPDTTWRSYFYDENGWEVAKVERGEGGSIALDRYAYDPKGGKIMDFSQYELKDEADLAKAMAESPSQLSMRPQSHFYAFRFEYDRLGHPVKMIRYELGAKLGEFREKVLFYPDGRMQAYFFNNQNSDGSIQTTRYIYDPRGLLLEIRGQDYQGNAREIRHEWE